MVDRLEGAKKLWNSTVGRLFPSSEERLQVAIQKFESLANTSFKTADDAAKAGLEILSEISKITGHEYGAIIFERHHRFRVLFLTPGDAEDVRFDRKRDEINAEMRRALNVDESVDLGRVRLVGLIHTHVSGGSYSFSPQDFRTSYQNQYRMYLRHADDRKGRVFKLVPPAIDNVISAEVRKFIDSNNDVGLFDYLLPKSTIIEFP